MARPFCLIFRAISKYVAWHFARAHFRGEIAPSMSIAESGHASKSRLARGRLLILAAALLWSLAGVFIKFLDLPPLTIVFYRSLFAALVFTPFLRRIRWQLNAPIMVSAVTYTAAISAFVAANKLTTAANAIVLQYTAPIFVFIFSRLVLGETIAKLNGFALTVSMIGVAVISLDSAGAPDMTGVLLAILSGILFAAYMINLRRTHEVSLIYLTWINNIACALLLLWIVKSELTTIPTGGFDSLCYGRAAAGHALLALLERAPVGLVAGSFIDRLDRAGAESDLGSSRGR